ncbi:MAG: arginine--tRNA ligase [Bacteroidia bacterium]|nr:arginine--tRNA ligase [Bacteroidia bacterium]
MTTIPDLIQQAAAEAVRTIWGVTVAPADLTINETKKEFTGDFTLVTFPLTKHKLGSPEQIGEKLGAHLVASLELLSGYNVIKGFLNLSLSDTAWLGFVASAAQTPDFFRNTWGAGQTVVVEYCSPNTNKPLHLGHLRNIVLGYALREIMAANGFHAVPVCLFNDRGTNISKSMLAWQRAGLNETPEQAGVKGDKLVGNYYVKFAQQLKAEVAALQAEGLSPEAAEAQAPSNLAIRDMTVRWEAGDPDTRALWKTMNGWVYTAMEDTFRRLGVNFERYYYESDIYLKGKETVQEGLENGIFFQKPDGSIWVDLQPDGLDQKLLLRSYGTSVYITQDLALADEKYQAYRMDRSIHVVGNEQDYHFKVLFLIMQKLHKPFASGLYHLSYGMVELPTGKMKSREGTVVDADDLLDEMITQAAAETQQLGKTEGMDEHALQALYETLGIGALKYFLLKVDPRKRMVFDPNESIDMHGHTGPFIQSSYTRTASIRRKADTQALTAFSPDLPLEEPLLDAERQVMRTVMRYPQTLREAAETYNPALIANYAYELAKDYNRFYHEAPVLRTAFPHTSTFRLALSSLVGDTLRESLRLIGINVPERM